MTVHRISPGAGVMYGIVVVVILTLGGCDDYQDSGFAFSVISYNVGDYEGPQPTTAQVGNLLLKHGVPDVLFIQNTPWLLEIKDLAKLIGLPYFVAGKESSPRNTLGILSRFPLRDANVILFQGGVPQPAAMCAKTTIATKDVLLCSLHLQSFSNKIRPDKHTGKLKWTALSRVVREELFGDTQRSLSVDQFLNWLDLKPADAIIVGGDFNSFPLSKPIRAMSSRFKDAFWPSWNYFRGTYKGLDSPIKPRPDFIFSSESVVCIDTRIVTESAGDHYPIQARLELHE